MTRRLRINDRNHITVSRYRAVPLELSSNPGEDMDVCKCKVSLRQDGTLNSHRAASPLLLKNYSEEQLMDVKYALAQTPHIGTVWKLRGGRGSRVVKVSDRGWPCHEFVPGPLKTRHVKCVESPNVLPLVWCGS
ncbi:hypothetical protein TNCV_2511871 [Trichonephila clavipes]|nr:hypothetical protein TNCV_2511871 [Trichonephila clavipes]